MCNSFTLQINEFLDLTFYLFSVYQYMTLRENNPVNVFACSEWHL